MVRHYKRKTQHQAWSSEDLKQALAAVKSNKESLRAAGKKFGIPFATLHRHLKNSVQSPGKLGRFRPVFDNEFEKQLVEHCVEMQKRFYGLSAKQCRKLAYDLADRNQLKHPFSKTDKMAGVDWMEGFMRRHPELSLRQPEPTSLSRATGFNRVQVSAFFELLKAEIEKNCIMPDRIFNMDETGITTVHNPGKIISAKGQKQVGRMVSGERGKNITVVCSVNGTGCYVPPMFIFPRVRMTDRLLVNGPIGVVGFAQKSGWMDSNLFVRWLEHFIQFAKPSCDQPVLLLLDGHGSHKTLEAIETARANGVILLCFPPHCTHRMQPLDVSFFGPLKRYYKEEADKWMTNHVSQRISDYDVAGIFGAAYLRCATMEKAVNGFRATGISPFNPDIFSADDFAPSLATEQPLPAPTVVPLGSTSVLMGPVPATPTIPIEPVPATPTSGLKELSGSTKHSIGSTPVPMEPSCVLLAKRVSVSEIASLPLAHHVGPRKRKAQKAEVLTSSPFKHQMEELKQKKVDLEAGRRRRLELKNHKEKFEKQSAKRKQQNTSKSPAAKKSRNNSSTCIADEQFFCLYCNQLYTDPPTEDWIQCCICKKWSHESCAPVDSADFACDFCSY